MYTHLHTYPHECDFKKLGACMQPTCAWFKISTLTSMSRYTLKIDRVLSNMHIIITINLFLVTLVYLTISYTTYHINIFLATAGFL